MKATDRILIGIVVGIVLLVVVALVVTLTRPEPSYQAEDTPEGVVHNYLLALQQGDYYRAYGYLSPNLRGYPSSVGQFTRDINRNRWQFQIGSGISLSVFAATTTTDHSFVSVRRTQFDGGDLFESGRYSYTFEMELELEGSEWKIVSSDSYFDWNWLED